MHEIVTLQFGQQSNYLGTHFWNTQESYFTYSPEPESPINHDILFRPGLAPDGSETFTPRTLIYDLKGALGSMRKVNALYEAKADTNVDLSTVWPSKPIIQRSQPIPQSDYQVHLDAGLEPPALSNLAVRYWSDYSRVFYHPKSLIQLSEFEVNDNLMPFEKWEVGIELFEKLEREIDLVDRDLRPFVEECDGLQGLQIITGVDDAWGGWASGWLERLRDEFGKASIWSWGLGDQGANMGVPREKQLQQIANSSRSLYALAEQSSVYAPVLNQPFKSPSYLMLDPTSSWHIGAMQTVALESMTISSRLRASDGRRGALQDIEETINSTGKRRIAKLELSIADPDILLEKPLGRVVQARSAAPLRRGSEEHKDQLADFDIDVFTKDYKISAAQPRKKEHVFGRVEVSRGEWMRDAGDLGRESHDRFGEGPTVQRYSAPLLFPLLNSFPKRLFAIGSGQATNIAVHAGLTTSTGVAEQVRGVEAIVRRMVSLDEREQLCNGLHEVAEEYDEGWESGGEDDDDD